MTSKLFRTGIGQDSHRFLKADSSKPCIVAGEIFDGCPGCKANSDGDVVYHALCNAITSLTGILILGDIADELCLKQGITDSGVYLREGVKTLGRQEVVHVAVTIEGKRPHFKDHILAMRENIAQIMGIRLNQVGITATTGEGLTEFGCGEGLQCFCVITTQEERG